MTQKIMVECILPKDYCLSNIFKTDDLPLLEAGSFYSLTKENKLIKKILREDGFSFEDVELNLSLDVKIQQMFVTDSGTWNSCFLVSVDGGYIKDIYEVATVLL